MSQPPAGEEIQAKQTGVGLGTSLSDIGNRIAQLRKKRGMSQADLAKALVTKRSNIGMWESGERDLKSGTLLQIADYFSVTVDFLLCGREAENIDIYRATGLSQAAIESLRRFKEDNFIWWSEDEDVRKRSLGKCEALSIALSSKRFLNVVASLLLLKQGEPGYYYDSQEDSKEEYYKVWFSPDMFAATLTAHLSLIMDSLRRGEGGELPPYEPAVRDMGRALDLLTKEKEQMKGAQDGKESKQ